MPDFKHGKVTVCDLAARSMGRANPVCPQDGQSLRDTGLGLAHPVRRTRHGICGEVTVTIASWFWRGLQHAGKQPLLKII